MIKAKEVWKSVPGYPNYEVSSIGRVQRVVAYPGCHCGVIKGTTGRRKYFHLFDAPGHSISMDVGRIIALAFIGPPPTCKHVAAHNDGNPLNNIPSNIRWATVKENAADMHKHGTVLIGSKNYGAVLSEQKVKEMRKKREAGMLFREIAAEFKVSIPVCFYAVTGHTWGHVK